MSRKLRALFFYQGGIKGKAFFEQLLNYFDKTKVN